MISEQGLASIYFSDPTIFAHEVLSEHFNTIRHDDHRESWRDHIGREIQRADFAVFDWRIEITENMEWELQEVLTQLPLDRVLIVSDHRTKGQAEDAVRRVAGPRSRDVNVHIFPDPMKLAERYFREVLRTRLTSLHVEPRRSARRPLGRAL